MVVFEYMGPSPKCFYAFGVFYTSHIFYYSSYRDMVFIILKPPAFELKSGYAIVWVHTGNILNWRMATNMDYIIFIHFLNRPSENVSHNGKNYKNLFCLVKLFTNQFVSVKLKLDLFHLFYTNK